MLALRSPEPEFDNAVLGHPKGFVPLKNPEKIALCEAYMARAWDSKRELRVLANSLGLSINAICVLLHTKKRVNGKQCRVLFAIFENSASLSGLLLDVGAVYDNTIKGWAIPCYERCLAPLREKLSQNFGLVLCDDGGTIGLFENQFYREVKRSPVIHLHEDAVTVTDCLVRNAIIEARAQDKVDPDSIHIHDTADFVKLPPKLKTLLPWLLVQFSVHNDKPRFGAFNTVTCRLDAVTFGHASASTKLLLGRFNSEIGILARPPTELILVATNDDRQPPATETSQ